MQGWGCPLPECGGQGHHVAQRVCREIFRLCWDKQKVCRSERILCDCAERGRAIEEYVIVGQIGCVCDGALQDGGVVCAHGQKLFGCFYARIGRDQVKVFHISFSPRA